MAHSFRGGGGFPSRDGLNTRSMFGQPPEQAQVSIDMGPAFDLNTEVEGLRSQVGQLKQISRAIGEESALQRQAAEGLEELLEKGRGAMKKAMKRLNRAYDQSKSNHMLYLVLFILGVFFVVYMWIKMYRLVKWVV
ncbi:hypothetical protein WJX72_006826 [[Myrmecia] bisecta]|uniref:t-SNARE coiled-coil homology domain-containing protein n=1 Tax=[Myrmecia] bisecta TaxID=41462 RepID=A0AAW1Q7M7_9CHLO